MRSFSFAAEPSLSPCSRQRSREQSDGVLSVEPKRLAWIKSHSAEKSANRPSENICSRSTSIQAGRGQARIVAHQTQGTAVRDNTPERMGGGVQIVLQKLGRGPAAGLFSEPGQALIDAGLAALCRRKRG